MGARGGYAGAGTGAGVANAADCASRYSHSRLVEPCGTGASASASASATASASAHASGAGANLDSGAGVAAYVQSYTNPLHRK